MNQDYEGMAGVIGPSTNWNFASLNSKANSVASVDDIASDVAQNDGNSSLGVGADGDFPDAAEFHGLTSVDNETFGDDADAMDRVFLDEPPRPGGFIGEASEGGPRPLQLESIDDEYPTSYDDADIPPPPSESEQLYLGQITEQTWDANVGIHKVPPTGGLMGMGMVEEGVDDGASDKVAEIRVNDDDEPVVSGSAAPEPASKDSPPAKLSGSAS